MPIPLSPTQRALAMTQRQIGIWTAVGKYGVSTVLLIVVFFTVLKPMSDAMIRNADRQVDANVKFADGYSTIADTVSRQQRIVEDLSNNQRAFMVILKDVHDSQVRAEDRDRRGS